MAFLVARRILHRVFAPAPGWFRRGLARARAVRWAMRLVPVLLACFSESLWSQTVALAPEYNVKAACLLHFAQFAEWPARAFTSSNAPIIVGVLGSDSFDRALEDTCKDEVANNRRLVVKRVESSEDFARCHILFISRTEKDRIPALLSGLKDAPVLTVSEIEKFCQRGGMINFYVQDNKVKFEANPEAAERSGLKLSSKMLRLAKITRTEL